MPLTVLRNSISNLYSADHTPEVRKGEVVTFSHFVSWDHDTKKQTIAVTKANGQKVNLTQKDINILGNYINVDHEERFQKPQTIKEVREGQSFLTLDAELSQIGAGQIVHVRQIGEVFSETDALLQVENQWGGRDWIGLHEIAYFNLKS